MGDGWPFANHAQSFVCICPYMHIVHIHTCIYAYMHIDKYKHTSIHPCMQVSICVRVPSVSRDRANQEHCVASHRAACEGLLQAPLVQKSALPRLPMSEGVCMGPWSGSLHTGFRGSALL